MNIRAARIEEVAKLDEIAFAAKAHWGYAAEQLALWREELRTSPPSILTWPTFVAEDEAGDPVAFAQLDPTRVPWELVALWVRPAFMGRGIGRALLNTARECAAAADESSFSIDADPHAANFYNGCGAAAMGHVAAPIPGEPDRVRPQFLLQTRGPMRP